MANVEEHVVSMQFNNKDFEKNAEKSLGTLDKLKKALHFKDSGESLKKLGEEADKLDFSKAAKSLEVLEKRFSTFGIVGMTAIQNITNSAMDLGKSIVKDVMKPMTNAVNQIKTGGLNRAFNLEHAHFQLMGLVNDEEKVAEILNGPVAQAVDGTAYGLDQAAVAASSLVASGLQTEQLLGPLKAIAGVASMTGRDYSDIADIFTTVASNGKLMTMQLRQLSASGLNASAALAKSMNKTEAEINEMVTQGKISFAQFSDAMSEAFGENAARANETFSGALSNVKAALSRIGAKVATPGLEQIRDLFNEIRPRINDFNTLVDAGIQHINNIVARFSQLGQKILKSSAFMDIMTRAANAFNMSMERLDKLLSTNGPIIYGFQALGNIIKAIQSFIEPVIKAFLDIFPPQSIYRIAEMVKHFRDFTASLIASEEVAKNIQRTFRGVFSVIRGVGSVIKMVAGFVFDFIKSLAPAGTMLTDVFGTVGDILTDVGYYIQVIKTAIEYTVNYFNIFGNIGSVIGKVFSSVGGLVSNVIKLVGGGVSWIINSILSIFGVVLPPIRSAGDLIAVILEGVGYAISFILGLVNKLAGFIGNIAEVFGQGASAVKDFGISIDSTGGIIKVFSVALNVLKTIISAVIVAIGSLFDGVEGAGGIFSTLKDFFVGFANAISNAWRTYSTFIKSTFFSGASTIGSTLGMLAGKLKEFASGLTLSRIAAAAFVATMIAIAVAITRILFTVDKVIDSFTGAGKSVQNFFNALSSRISPTVTPVQKLTAVLKQLAIVIVVVTGALVILANTPNVDEAVKNLGLIAAGIAVLTLLVTGLAKLAQKARLTRQIAAVSASMLAISASILVLSLALRTMNGVDTTDILAKSAAISLMTIALGGSAALMSKIAPNLSKGMLGLLFFAFSVKKVTEALSIITNSDLNKIKEGLPTLLAIFAGLSVLAVALGNVRLTSGLGFLLVALAIKMMIPVISDAINAAAKIDFQPLMDFIEEYRYSLLAIGGVAIAAVLVGRALSSSVKAFAVGLLALTGAVALLFNIVERVGNMDMGVLKRGGAAVGQVLIIFGLLMVASALTRKAKPMQMGASFFLMAGAIAALTGCIFLLGKMDPAVLKQGGIAVGAMLGIFGVLMGLSALTAKAQPMKIGAMFVAMAGAIAALTGCMYIIGLMEPDKLQKGTIAVGIMLGAFALIVGLSALTKKAQPSKMAVMFLAMAGAILAISHCIETLGSLSLEQILKGSVPIAALMLLLTGVATKLSNLDIKSMKSTIVLVGGVIAMIATVVAAVMILGEQPVGNVIQGGVVIFAMLKVIEKFGERIVKIANGMNNWMSAIVLLGGVIGALWTIVGSLVALSSINVGKLIISGTVLLGVVFVIQKIMQEIDKSKINPATLAGFYEATRIVAIIALAIAGVAVFCSWPEILSAGATISGVLALFGQLMIKMSKDGTRIKTKQLQNFLKASGILIIIAGSITALAMSSNWPEILSAGGAIAGVLAVFAYIFKYVSKVKIQPKDMAGFLTAALVIGEIAVFASLLAQSAEWDQIAASCLGIAAVVYALGKILAHFGDSGWQLEKTSLVKVGHMLVKLGAVMVVLGTVVDNISKLANSGASWQQIIAAAGGISGVLLALAGVCTILGNIDGGAATKGALVAVKILGIFVGAGGILVLVASLLNSIKGMRKFIVGGGNLLEAFSTAIGKFIGGFVKGFGMAVLDLVEAAGKTLSQFGKDIIPFVDEMKNVDNTVMDGVGVLIGVILALGAAKFMSAITNILTLGLGNMSLREDLIAFAQTMADFNSITSGITDANRFKTIAEATKELAGVVKVINENKDSLFEKIFDKAFGLNDFTDQAAAMGSFIGSIATLAKETKDISDSDATKLSVIGTAVKALADSIPEEPGLWDKIFTGYKDISKSGTDLENFGESLKKVSKMLSSAGDAGDEAAGINVDNIKKLATVAKVVKKLNNAMPDFISLGEYIIDDDAKQTFSNVGNELAVFAEWLRQVADMSENQISETGLNNFERYVTIIGRALKAMPVDELHDNELSGDEYSKTFRSLTAAGMDLNTFITELKTANDELNGVDLTPILGAAPIIQAIGDIYKGLAGIKVNGGSNDIPSLSNVFTNFSDSIEKLNGITKDFDGAQYEKFAKALKKVLKAFEHKFGSDDAFKGVSKLTTNLMGLNTTMKDLKLYAADDFDAFTDALNKFKEQYTAFANDVGNADMSGKINIFANNFETLKKALMGIDTSSKEGKAAFKQFTSFAESMKNIGDALAILTGTDTNISLLTEYLKGFETQITDLGTTLEGFDVKAFQEKVQGIADAFMVFQEDSTSKKGSDKSKSFRVMIQNLTQAVKNIKNLLTNFQEDIQKVIEKMPSLGKDIIDSLKTGLTDSVAIAELKQGGNTVIETLNDAMDPNKSSTIKTKLIQTGNNIVVGFRNGLSLDANAGGFWQVGIDAAQKFIGGFTSKKGMDEASPSKRMKKSGDYAVQGFINGIIADEDKLKKSGTNMGSTFLDALDNDLGIHSPAAALFERAKQVVAGWLGGLKDGAGKIFESGNSFGGDFLGGLKNAIEKIKKGDFNGDSILENLKKKLGINKLVDAKKDASKIGKNLGKALETAGNTSDAKKGAGGAGSKMGNEAAKEFKKAYSMALISGYNTIGSEVVAKDLAKAMNITKDNAIKILNEYKKSMKELSDSSEFLKAALSNPASVIKFGKAWKKQTAYVSRLTKDLNDTIIKGNDKISKSTLTMLGKMAAANTKEYKTAEKKYMQYTKHIARNTETVLAKMDKLDKYYNKYKKASDKKDKARWKKRVETVEKSITKLESSTIDLRKKAAAEEEKMVKATIKNLKKIRKEIRETVKSWLDFSSIETTTDKVITGYEKWEDESDTAAKSTDELSDSVGALNGLLDKNEEQTNNNAKAYDALSASMDTGLNLFEKFNKKGTVQSDALFENADSQLEAYEEFQNGIEELEARGLDMSIVDQLAGEGPEALDKVRGFLSMTADEIVSYNQRVIKQHEFEEKALERSLRRQYEQYQEWVGSVNLLKLKLVDNSEIVKAVASAGTSSLSFVKTLLGLDGSALEQSKFYFAEGLKDIQTFGFESLEKSTVTESAEKLFNLEDLIANMTKNRDTNKKMKELYQKALDLGMDKSLAEDIYNQGANVAIPFFEGLTNEMQGRIEDANALWKEFQQDTKENAEEAGDTLATIGRDYWKQVHDQNNNIAAEDGLASLLKIIKGNASNMDMSTEAIEGAYKTLVSDLKESGKSSSQIYDILKEYLNNTNGEQDSLKWILKDINTRTANNIQESGKAVKESWMKATENMKQGAKALGSITDKMGDSLSKEVFDYLQTLSPEQLMAMDTLSEAELKQMAKEYTDANDASDYIADAIYAKYVKAWEKGFDNVNTWLKNYAYDTTKDVGNQDDVTYELAQYVRDGRAAGKSIRDMYAEINNMSKEEKAKIFKFDAKDGFKGLNAMLATWGDSIKKGIRSDLNIANDMASVIDLDTESNRGTLLKQAMASGDSIRKIVGDTFGGSIHSAAESEAVKGAYTFVGKVHKDSLNAATKSTPELVVKIGKNIASSLKKAAKSDEVQKVSEKYNKAGEKLGKDIVNGMANGIADKDGTLTKAISKLAQKVINTAKSKDNFDEHSPSKKFIEIGEYLNAGLAKGIADSSYAETAVTKVAHSTIEAMREAIQGANNEIDGSLDLSPTITPKLDLSLIRSHAGSINRLFDARVEANAKLVAENQNEGTNVAPSTTFIQNNYSPKALSREEIYRQTQNQFAMARKAVIV